MVAVLPVPQDVNVYDESGVLKLRSYGWRQCRLAPPQSTTLMMSTEEVQLLTSVLQVFSLYIVPLLVLSIFNMKLTRFLKTNANRMARNRMENRQWQTEQQDRKTSKLIRGKTHSPCTSSTRSSIAERANERRTSRTTSLLIAMAGSYAALWLPFTLVSLLLDLDILYVVSKYPAYVLNRIKKTKAWN
ncbi:hypothetical protein KIN20_023634 [Parelaphostrongylus tenuis]|uniref:G-protein coupled receptors family 1 profile domain-containing protein n=1 Tax=Parelaphostrongylus tenuis TaxID=148309 RepID=A0AAD5MVW9_PARTN|nr:hypothetical protein KIN20_023634 [Parelaphostrongylus tenuis]